MRACAMIGLAWGTMLCGQTPGSLDPSFNPTDLGLGKGDGRVGLTRDLAVLPDGRFLAVGDQGPNINRYLVDGTIDPTFTVPAFSFATGVRCVELQSDGKILVGGNFTTVSGVSRNRIARLLADGALDTSFDPGTGFNNTVLAIAVQADGAVLVGGAFTQFNGAAQVRIARLTSTGVIDASFVVGSGFTSTVNAMVVQPDTKILVGQGGTTYNGGACDRLLRLNANGTLDGGFNGPGAGPNGIVYCIALRDDGRIDVGGVFTTYNTTSRSRMARVLGDGTLDASFSTGTGFDSDVLSLLAKPSGEVLVGGQFITFNGTYRAYHARLSSSGSLVGTYDGACGYGISVFAMAEQSGGRTLIAGYYGTGNGNSSCRVERFSDGGVLDVAFDPGTGINSGVGWSVIPLPDGKVLATGIFTKYNGQRAIGLVRIGVNGEYDPTFQTGFGAHQGCVVCANVACAAVQADGKILVGGIFPYFNGVAAPGLVRLNTDGSIDPSFVVTGIVPSGTLSLTSIAIQSDGGILISGGFQTIYGTPRVRIARLLPSGALDAAFDPGTGMDASATVIKVQSNGSIIAGGGFTTYNSVSSAQLVRILPSGTRDGTLNVGSGFDGLVADVEVLATGWYVVGGNFANYNGAPAPYLATLNGTGAPQNIFPTATSPVRAISAAGTNYIYVVGGYTFSYAVNRLPFSGGAVDASFQAGMNSAYDMALVFNDARPLVLGSSFFLNGSSKNRIARLLAEPLAALQLKPRVMLQGAYGSASLMRDDLRVQGLVPLSEPYSANGYVYVGSAAGASTTPAVLATTGADAVVDWVVVELRSSSYPQWLRASCAGLLQRDGDIIAPGGGPLTMSEFADAYRIVVRHRNHLPIASAFSYNLTTTLSGQTLTGATSAFGTNAQALVDVGLYGLWSGDVTGNGTISYTGANNDRDPILTAIGGTLPTATLTGQYRREDVNMDGTVKYVGANNDRDPILVNIGGTMPTNIRVQQLP